jgi:type II secretory pathway component GspD/PulD (secretin)
MRFRFKKLAACALFGFAVGAFAHTAIAQSESEVSDEHAPRRYVLIELEYADAEEIAHVLRQLLPPTVSVVAYSPTNSVLIAGDPAVLEGIEARDVEAVQ